MNAPDALVVVGAGQAGAELAVTARQLGWPGPIHLVGAELHPPYQRPPLSKGLLAGGGSTTATPVRALPTYAAAGVDLVLGTSVTGVDLARRTVELDDGRTLGYRSLALTTGGRPRRLPLVEGTAADTLHTLEDARSLGAALRPGLRLLVVGGGFVGLEVAAVAAGHGAAVTVVEARPRLLERTCPAPVAAFFAAAHAARGVDVRTGVSVVRVDRTAVGLVVHLDDGSTVAVDRVLAGIGQVADDALARSAGLAVHDGVLVDQRARTSDPHVVAAGDCTRQLHGFLGVRLRLESQQNAGDQARIAARTACGLPPVAAAVPTFWSDQYEHTLQIAGVAAPGDRQVVRGDPRGGGFSVLTLRGDLLTSVQAVDRPRDFAAGRKLLARRARVGPPDALAGPAPLTDLVTQGQENPCP